MKKFLAFLLAVAMCFSLAACSSDSSEMTLEKYIDGMQDEIDAMTESVKDQGMTIEVSAKENSLVYSYHFTEDLGDTSLVKDSLEQSLDEFSSTFEDILSALKEEVSSAESVIVEYLDMDGNVIVSKEYK